MGQGGIIVGRFCGTNRSPTLTRSDGWRKEGVLKDDSKSDEFAAIEVLILRQIRRLLDSDEVRRFTALSRRQSGSQHGSSRRRTSVILYEAYEVLECGDAPKG